MGIIVRPEQRRRRQRTSTARATGFWGAILLTTLAVIGMSDVVVRRTADRLDHLLSTPFADQPQIARP